LFVSFNCRFRLAVDGRLITFRPRDTPRVPQPKALTFCNTYLPHLRMKCVTFAAQLLRGSRIRGAFLAGISLFVFNKKGYRPSLSRKSFEEQVTELESQGLLVSEMFGGHYLRWRCAGTRMRGPFLRQERCPTRIDPGGRSDNSRSLLRATEA
jgi:hypothetical protein